jgi:WD40 repeat protein
LYSVAFSPDGKRVVACGSGGLVAVWEADTGRQLVCRAGDQATFFGAAFSPDGKRVVAAGAGETLRWDVNAGKALCRLRDDWEVTRCVAFSPDGKRILSAGECGTLAWPPSWVGALGVQQQPFGRAFPSPVFTDPSANPESRHRLRLWDWETGKELCSFKGHTSTIWSGTLSADGRRVLSASADMTLRLWDAETGKELRCFKGHTGAVVAAAFSPDGKSALSASEDGTIRMWQLPEKESRPSGGGPSE